jgi:hypothetical protein
VIRLEGGAMSVACSAESNGIDDRNARRTHPQGLWRLASRSELLRLADESEAASVGARPTRSQSCVG